MLNVGEQLVSSYLRYIRKCDFIQTNLYTIESQGEIDVVGLNIAEQQVYICEVAIHLTTGLQYVRDNRPNNVQKLTDKFSRDIEYARKYLDEYNQHFMLWSPIVKDTQGNPANNQTRHLEEIKANIQEQYSIEIEFIVNERFQECLVELRNYARAETKNIQCPLVRLMQIEVLLDKHVSNRPAPRRAIDIQTERRVESGYSEFWAPIRAGEFGEIFAGSPVLIRNESWISTDIRTIGVNLHLNNHDCYVQLYFRGADPEGRRNKVMTLFPKSDYTYEYKDSPKSTKVKFPVLDKGKKDRDDWDEIRYKLVSMGTDIYNKIRESDV